MMETFDTFYHRNRAVSVYQEEIVADNSLIKNKLYTIYTTINTDDYVSVRAETRRWYSDYPDIRIDIDIDPYNRQAVVNEINRVYSKDFIERDEVI